MKNMILACLAFIAMPFASSTVQGKIKELQTYSITNPEKPNACTNGNIYVVMDNNMTYWHAGAGGEGANNPMVTILMAAYATGLAIKLEVEDAGSNCAPSNFKRILAIKMAKP